MNIATATPVEIDTELARLSHELFNLQMRQEQRAKLVAHYSKMGTRYADSVKSYEDEVAKLGEEINAKLLLIDPLNAEFQRRGGWTRAFLVNNSNGHVHKDRNCNTCFYNTDFVWMTSYSDHDEAEIVADAGERACTVCYPTAPALESFGRTTKMFTPSEVEKAKAREERAAKKAAADAAKITVIDYQDFGRTSNKEFKTARAVTNMIAGELSSLCWYGEYHPSANEWLWNIKAGREALIAAGIEYDYDKALASARKKAGRESSEGSQY